MGRSRFSGTIILAAKIGGEFDVRNTCFKLDLSRFLVDTKGNYTEKYYLKIFLET